MTGLRTAAQAVIDNYELRHKFDMDVLIKDLRQALAEYDKRKPVAWQVQTEHYGAGYIFDEEFLEAFTRFPLPSEPVEPAEAMILVGGHINSEWLNDNAPIGEARYQLPIKAIYKAMLEAARGVE